MPFDIQISLQKLLTGLIVVIVPHSVVGLYLTSNADSSLQQTVGMYFRTMAQTEAASTSQFISGRIVDVQAVAGDPNIVDAGDDEETNSRLSILSVSSRRQRHFVPSISHPSARPRIQPEFSFAR